MTVAFHSNHFRLNVGDRLWLITQRIVLFTWKNLQNSFNKFERKYFFLIKNSILLQKNSRYIKCRSVHIFIDLGKDCLISKSLGFITMVTCHKIFFFLMLKPQHFARAIFALLLDKSKVLEIITFGRQGIEYSKFFFFFSCLDMIE